MFSPKISLEVWLGLGSFPLGTCCFLIKLLVFDLSRAKDVGGFLLSSWLHPLCLLQNTTKSIQSILLPLQCKTVGNDYFECCCYCCKTTHSLSHLIMNPFSIRCLACPCVQLLFSEEPEGIALMRCFFERIDIHIFHKKQWKHLFCIMSANGMLLRANKIKE